MSFPDRESYMSLTDVGALFVEGGLATTNCMHHATREGLFFGVTEAGNAILQPARVRYNRLFAFLVFNSGVVMQDDHELPRRLALSEYRAIVSQDEIRQTVAQTVGRHYELEVANPTLGVGGWVLPGGDKTYELTWQGLSPEGRVLFEAG